MTFLLIKAFVKILLVQSFAKIDCLYENTLYIGPNVRWFSTRLQRVSPFIPTLTHLEDVGLIRKISTSFRSWSNGRLFSPKYPLQTTYTYTMIKKLRFTKLIIII